MAKRVRVNNYKQNALLLEQISKNYIRGATIESIDEIIDAANFNQALYHIGFGIKPAAWFYHLSLALLMRYIYYGSISKIIKIK